MTNDIVPCSQNLIRVFDFFVQPADMIFAVVNSGTGFFVFLSDELFFFFEHCFLRFYNASAGLRFV